MTTQGTKLVATEANVIRDCVKRVLAGQSLRSVCQGLNDRAISTVTGTPWNPSVLRRILMSARISGQRYLLPGVLRCSHCGALLVSRPRADGARRYVCAKGPGFAGCNKTTILAETLESYVVDAVLHRLDTPELEAAIRGELARDDQSAAVQADLDRTLAQLDELAAAYAAREFPLREWLAARKPLDQEAERLKLTWAPVLADYVGNTATLRKQWPDLDLSRQRAVVRAVLDHVVIGPAVRGRTRFDPSRVRPVWRL